ncbi:MAG: class I adenylate-forming enzyme family protein [Acidimicrobiia bacterium]
MTPTAHDTNALTVDEMFRRAVDVRHDALALEFHGHLWSFSEVLDESLRLASVFANLGVRPGDRVTIFAENSPHHVMSALAAARLGAIVAPMGAQLTAHEVAYLLTDCRPSVVLVDLARRPVVDAAISRSGHTPVVIETDGASSDGYSTLLFAASPFAGPTEHDASSDLAIWYTSGTTGRPKGAVWSHRTFVTNSVGSYMVPMGVTTADANLYFQSIGHNGLATSVIAPLLIGSRIHLRRRLSPPDIVAAIGDLGCTVTSGSPSSFSLVCHAAEQQGIAELPSMRALCCGATALTPEIYARIRNLFPNAGIYTALGSSEAMFTIAPPSTVAAKPGTVGRAMPGQVVEVHDANGQPCPPNTVGTIVMRGSSAMSRYWEKPDATAAAMKGGWLTVGDLGRFDDDGDLWMAGRHADVINTGGYNVYASEVEAVLLAVDGVRQAAVLGEPDPELGEVVVAYVTTHEGTGVDAEDLIAVCGERLARYKNPRRVEVVVELPSTPLGKVQKFLIPTTELEITSRWVREARK